MIAFTVYGTPEPQGSARAFYRPGMKAPVVTSDNPDLKGWRTLVAYAAQGHAGQLLAGPVRLTVTFAFPKPKSAPRSRTHHTTRPDLDKLVRAVCDALTGICWRDDAQVVTLVAAKGYGPEPAAHITVETA